jgi:hypothetical protein
VVFQKERSTWQPRIVPKEMTEWHASGLNERLNWATLTRGSCCAQQDPNQLFKGGAVTATPNPSLKLTRYGRHCKPGLSHSHYRLSPGLQYLPPRAA